MQQVKALGCSEMQGFLFSPPRRIEDLLQLFRSRPERKVAALAERRSA